MVDNNLNDNNTYGRVYLELIPAYPVLATVFARNKVYQTRQRVSETIKKRNFSGVAWMLMYVDSLVNILRVCN